MILYNTTFIVDTRFVEQFKEWVSTMFIPAAIDSGLFEQPLLTRILQPENTDVDAESFALQFKSADLEKAKRWSDDEAMRCLEAFICSHGRETLLTFSTFMEIL